MGNKIVKDSGLAIFVKTVAVAQGTAINTLVREGVKSGLVGDTPRLGEDGSYYCNVDTAALVRIDADTNAWTNGQIVYLTPGGAISQSATSNTAIGYADRPKTAASGPLFLQLVPRAV